MSKLIFQIKRTYSVWNQVALAPPDTILGISEAFFHSKNPNKVNLGVGAFRDDNGKPYVLPCVQKAEEMVMKQNLNKEYGPISGNPDFCKKSLELMVGSELVQAKSWVCAQSLSGTGALRLGTSFLAAHYPGKKTVYLSKPTWANHVAVCKHPGLEIGWYTYYNPKKVNLDFDGCIKSIRSIPEKSIIMLHACAHNPTGIDPTPDQWQELSNVIKQRNLLVFIDTAYQGFASGDLNRDALAIRTFLKAGHNVVLAQSYAKNMGLYGYRVGSLSISCDNKEESDRVMSQLKLIIRGFYSNPPIHGARIVKEILSNKDLMTEWIENLKGMSSRIISIRQKLAEALKAEGSSRDWSHITNQIGMFCFTGLSAEQVRNLTENHAIFLTKDGRICMAAVTTKNLSYLAKAIHSVTKYKNFL